MRLCVVIPVPDDADGIILALESVRAPYPVLAPDRLVDAA
jgi:hypothetical protein